MTGTGIDAHFEELDAANALYRGGAPIFDRWRARGPRSITTGTSSTIRTRRSPVNDEISSYSLLHESSLTCAANADEYAGCAF